MQTAIKNFKSAQHSEKRDFLTEVTEIFAQIKTIENKIVSKLVFLTKGWCILKKFVSRIGRGLWDAYKLFEITDGVIASHVKHI